MEHTFYVRFLSFFENTHSLPMGKIADDLNFLEPKLLHAIKTLQGFGVAISLSEEKQLQFIDKPLKPFSVNTICSLISEEHGISARNVHLLTSTNSTNSHLKKQMFQAALPVICLAEHQAAGRGRRGKTWISPLGSNIYLSVRVKIQLSQEKIGMLSLVSGLAVVNALQAVGLNKLAIKWPNDVYCNGKKLGGILIEAVSLKNDEAELIIGIGVNVKMPNKSADNIDQDWTDLSQQLQREELCRSEISGRIINQLLNHIQAYQNNDLHGFAEDWSNYDYLKDKEVSITGLHIEMHGVAKGIDEKGQLLILSNNQLHALNSGEVSVKVSNQEYNQEYQ